VHPFLGPLYALKGQTVSKGGMTMIALRDYLYGLENDSV